MKKLIAVALSVLSVFSATPTAWAIYAGVMEVPAFPMWQPAAIIGSMAVVSTTAAAGLLIVDILKHNSEARNDEEKKTNLPAWYGWAILAGCTVAEIILSLLIVVYSDLLEWGVLAFPLVTVAGVFALAVRMTLEERITDRTKERARLAQEVSDEKAKREAEAREVQAKHEQELALRRELRRTAKESARTAAESAPVQLQSVASPTDSAASASKYPHRCAHCAADAPDSIALIKNSNAVGGHMKKHHPELCKKSDKLVGEFFATVTKDATK